MRSTHQLYALAIISALCFGLGVSFWRSAVENKRLVAAIHAAEMARMTAEDDAKESRDSLRREVKARQFAETAQSVAEQRERGVREKLVRETKTRESAETDLRALNVKLAEETRARQA